jgi:hypothetical protein
VTCRRTVALGAYLLGALDPADRSEFEEHLNTFPTCQAELLRLAPLPGLLQRLTPEDYDAIEAEDERWGLAEVLDLPPALPPEVDLAEPPVPPVELVQPVPTVLPVQQVPPVQLVEPIEPVESVGLVGLVGPVEPVEPEERPARPSWLRRYRATLAAAAAVLLLALGGFAFLEQEPATTVTASPVSWTAVDPATGVSGRVDLIKRGWGTEVHLSMDDVPAGRKLCHMIVYGRDGSKEIAGQWTAGNYRSLKSAPGSTSIQLNDIDRIEVTAGGGLLVGIHSS